MTQEQIFVGTQIFVAPGFEPRTSGGNMYKCKVILLLLQLK